MGMVEEPPQPGNLFLDPGEFSLAKKALLPGWSWRQNARVDWHEHRLAQLLSMNRQKRTLLLAAILALLFNLPAAARAEKLPNLIIILADDLGYGDLGCYGHPTIRTPNLDRMAAEGMRFTDFYVAACVCTPSRAALLTGRLPIRSGMSGDLQHRVQTRNSPGGLPPEEITIARALKSKGYATQAIGKWHLGHYPQNLPTSHCFDGFYGLRWSNDMEPGRGLPRNASASLDPKLEWWNCTLMRNDQPLEQPTDLSTLTKRYTEEAVRFIQQNRKKPFFLYFAHTYPHVPLFASKQFQKTSPRGLYGDVVEELDWSVGQVLETLRKEGLAKNTMVFFTSDNGPWLVKELAGGSAGLLREVKAAPGKAACACRASPGGRARSMPAPSTARWPAPWTCSTLALPWPKCPSRRIVSSTAWTWAPCCWAKVPGSAI